MGTVPTNERNGARLARWANKLNEKHRDAGRFGKHRIDAEITEGR
jgi:hypothetical protein